MIDQFEYQFEKFKLFIKDEAEKPSGFKILTTETGPQAFDMGFREGKLEMAKKIQEKLAAIEWSDVR